MAPIRANLLLHAQIAPMTRASAQTPVTLRPAGSSQFVTMPPTQHAIALTHTMTLLAFSIQLARTTVTITVSATIYGTLPHVKSSTATIQTVLHASVHAMTRRTRQRATTASTGRRALTLTTMTSASAMIFMITQHVAPLLTARTQISEFAPFALTPSILLPVSSRQSALIQSIRHAYATTSQTQQVAPLMQPASVLTRLHARVVTQLIWTPATWSQPATTRRPNSASAQHRPRPSIRSTL